MIPLSSIKFSHECRSAVSSICLNCILSLRVEEMDCCAKTLPAKIAAIDQGVPNFFIYGSPVFIIIYEVLHEIGSC